MPPRGLGACGRLLLLLLASPTHCARHAQLSHATPCDDDSLPCLLLDAPSTDDFTGQQCCCPRKGSLLLPEETLEQFCTFIMLQECPGSLAAADDESCSNADEVRERASLIAMAVDAPGAAELQEKWSDAGALQKLPDEFARSLAAAVLAKPGFETVSEDRLVERFRRLHAALQDYDPALVREELRTELEALELHTTCPDFPNDRLVSYYYHTALLPLAPIASAVRSHTINGTVLADRLFLAVRQLHFFDQAYPQGSFSLMFAEFRCFCMMHYLERSDTACAERFNARDISSRNTIILMAASAVQMLSEDIPRMLSWPPKMTDEEAN